MNKKIQKKTNLTNGKKNEGKKLYIIYLTRRKQNSLFVRDGKKMSSVMNMLLQRCNSCKSFSCLVANIELHWNLYFII